MAKRVGRSREADKGGGMVGGAVNRAFELFRMAEFEILFFLFFIIVFLIFKDLTSRPEYNQLLVKRPAGDLWPY